MRNTGVVVTVHIAASASPAHGANIFVVIKNPAVAVVCSGC